MRSHEYLAAWLCPAAIILLRFASSEITESIFAAMASTLSGSKYSAASPNTSGMQVAVLATTGAPFGATAGFADRDSALSLVPHAGRPLEVRRVLATAFAAGGAAAWLVLERP